MGKLGKCPLCPQGTRDVLLIGGLCHSHFNDNLDKVERTPAPVKKSAAKPPKPVKKVSEKRKEEGKEYSSERKKFLHANPLCLAGLQGCLKLSTEVHHKQGRAGGSYLDKTTWLPVCEPCHKYIELHPAEAKEKNLSTSRNKKK